MRKMGRAAVLVLAGGLMAGMLGGCKNSSSGTGGSAAEQTKAETSGEVKTEAAGQEEKSGAAEEDSSFTVAGVVFQEDQFMQMITAGYKDAAAAAGVELMLANTSNDIAKEPELLNTYLAKGVKGVAITPLDPVVSCETIKVVSEKGLKISLCNMGVEAGDYIIGGYGSDDYNVGQTAGEDAVRYIKENLDGNAKIAIVQFKSQSPIGSTNRANGFTETVKAACPDVEIVADQDAWLQDKAVQVVGDILTANPEIDLVYAANEGGTVGAVMAVKNSGKAVKVFGTDASDQTISMLKNEDDILQAIAGQDPYTQGYKAMEILIRACRGEDMSATTGKIEVVPCILLSRNDIAAVEQYEADLAAKLKK